MSAASVLALLQGPVLLPLWHGCSCLTSLGYCRDPKEFSTKLEHALQNEPVPMTPELQKRLTWEDATERFLDVAELKAAERPGVVETAVDKLAWAAHNTLTGWLTTTLVCPCLVCHAFI